ncbi:MAG: hypothetical protein WC375_06270 [Methanomassiliicoccales archaeon]|jgi:hypothetical protein
MDKDTKMSMTAEQRKPDTFILWNDLQFKDDPELKPDEIVEITITMTPGDVVSMHIKEVNGTDRQYLLEKLELKTCGKQRCRKFDKDWNVIGHT